MKNMRKFMIAIMMVLPLAAIAQDNTWERIEQEPVTKSNPNAKYLVPNAVPEVDGKVVFEKTIEAPGKSASTIYDILQRQMAKMVREPNQLENSMLAVQDSTNYKLGAVFHEWLVFRSSALSLDRTKFNFVLTADCYDKKAVVRISHITYRYDEERNPENYTAEEWITDKYCVNKKHTKLYPISGKFRRKTIDRKDFIFNKFTTLLNEK